MKNNEYTTSNIIFNRIGRIILSLFSVAVFLLLVVCSITSIYFDLYGGADLPRFGKENIPLLFILLVGVLLITLLLYANTGMLREKTETGHLPGKPLSLGKMMKIAIIWAVFVGLYLVLSIRGLAVEDSKHLDEAINAFMAGDFSQLTLPGGYLNLYPYQLGYVAIGQGLAFFFGNSNYLVYQFINILSCTVTIWVLYQITWELFENSIICNLMAMLSTGMMFLFVFNTYIYGDMMSLAPEISALYLCIRYIKYHKIKDGIFTGVAEGVAVVLKTNAYIALIAIFFILVIAWTVNRDGNRNSKEFRSKITERVVLLFLILFLGWSMNAVIKCSYAKAADLHSIPEGAPISANIAMSIMDDSSTTPGWDNGYVLHTGMQCGFNYQVMDRESRVVIRQYMAKYAKRPWHGARFLTEKFLTQWADPTCISMRKMELASRHVNGHPAIVNSIIYGKGRTIFSWIMNVYQEIIYIGLAVYCVISVSKKKIELPQALIVLFIFGGMLFHEIWEANSRYVIPYYICMLPLAAYGIYSCIRYLTTIAIDRREKANEKKRSQ